MFIWTFPAASWRNSPYLRLAYHIPGQLQPDRACARPKSDRARLKPHSAAEQIRRDLLAGVDQTLHRADRLVERLAVLAGKLDLDNTLDAFRSDDAGHADIHVLDAEFAGKIGRAGQHAFLVA